MNAHGNIFDVITVLIVLYLVGAFVVAPLTLVAFIWAMIGYGRAQTADLRSRLRSGEVSGE